MSKYRMYVDEVGNPDLESSNNPNHRFLSLTGVIFELDYVTNILYPQIERLKASFFNSHPDDPIIFHRKELLYKKPPFSILQHEEIQEYFDEELIGLLKSWDYYVISVIIDKKEHNERYSVWKYDPYHYCQEILIERFRLFLDIHKSKGDMLFESRGGKEDNRLKQSFRRIMDGGTNNLTSSDLLNHFTSKELKIKPKTANISGLQVADLLAHPIRRYLFKTKFDMDDGTTTFADRIIEILISEKFFRYKGKINGYGTKKLP